jgi:transcriptional regulator with XRE-family HTH domain
VAVSYIINAPEVILVRIVLKDIITFNEMLIRKGFSKSKLARVAGLSSPMAVQISNGDRYPGPETAKRIVEALQVEWDAVFAIEKSPAKIG